MAFFTMFAYRRMCLIFMRLYVFSKHFYISLNMFFLLLVRLNNFYCHKKLRYSSTMCEIDYFLKKILVYLNLSVMTIQLCVCERERETYIYVYNFFFCQTIFVCSVRVTEYVIWQLSGRWHCCTSDDHLESRLPDCLLMTCFERLLVNTYSKWYFATIYFRHLRTMAISPC